jgi:recombination protein RecA
MHGIVEKSGSWYAYEGERIGQGKDNARSYLQQHPEIAAKIETALRNRLLPARRPVAVPSEAAEA